MAKRRQKAPAPLEEPKTGLRPVEEIQALIDKCREDLNAAREIVRTKKGTAEAQSAFIEVKKLTGCLEGLHLALTLKGGPDAY